MKNFNTIFLFLFVLCSINFFEFQAIRGSVIKYIQFIYLITGVVLSLPYLFPRYNKGYILPVQIISISIIFSIFISFITWKQSLIDSLGGSILVLVWVFFFYLKHINYSIKKIETIFLIYGIVYIILYFFQFTFSNKNYFINLDTIDESRGITRIVFPGQGVFYVTVFMALNKLTTQKKGYISWLILVVLGIIITVMQVTRQYIFVVIVIYLFHFLKDKSVFFKVSTMVFMIMILVFISQLNHPIIEGIRDTQEQTSGEGKDYVRIKAALFFLTDFSYSPINQIFGNGAPYGDNSPYNRYVNYYIANYGYWLSDVGLVAVYSMFGVFAVVGYLLIWLKSITIKVPKEFFYLKYYLWYLLLTSITSATSYLSSNLIITVLVIYVYQIVYEREKFLKKNHMQVHEFQNNYNV